MRSSAMGILSLMVLLAAWPARAGERPKLAVTALRLDTKLPEGMDRTLNEILLGEFHRRHGQEVLGASDIAAMLQVEQQKILLGCDDDSCLCSYCCRFSRSRLMWTRRNCRNSVPQMSSLSTTKGRMRP